tara:strand:+ start:711 stop:1301 length:591 start_codon:yes stop_codon:yes gene_type:complete
MSYIDNNGKFNHGKWLRDQLLTEAPMDKGFQKEWEGSTKALINHVKHQLQSGSPHKSTLQKMLKNLETVAGYPALMGRLFGMNEARPMASGPMVAGIEFKPGDMWSNDFDYVGMLKYSVAMEIPEDPNALLGVIDTLKALSDSYEDVNYHSENQDLGNAIEYIEDAKGIEDLERAQDFLEMHKRKAAKTLKDITRR